MVAENQTDSGRCGEPGRQRARHLREAGRGSEHPAAIHNEWRESDSQALDGGESLGAGVRVPGFAGKQCKEERALRNAVCRRARLVPWP
jgi:hypothetical protein